MVDTNAPHDEAWEAALEEAINRFEQGEAVNDAHFEELVAELKARQAALKAAPEDDPRVSKLEELIQRATQLESSAALGTGPTDEVSSILGGLTGSNATAIAASGSKG